MMFTRLAIVFTALAARSLFFVADLGRQSKSGSLTHSFAGEPDGVPNWPNGVPLGAGYVVPRTGGHGVVRV